jgi:Transposase DDE domain
MENAGFENWRMLLSLFPEGWEQLARDSGAVERLRGFASAEVLLRTLLMHIATGHSLRETVVHAKAADLASVSDVALLKRLRQSESWLQGLCIKLLAESGVVFPASPARRRLRIVDGTIVREPGKTGSQWRILYTLRLPDLQCDFFKLTSTVGEGTGESLSHVPVTRDQDVLLGDAGYGSTASIESAVVRGADVLVRINPQIFQPEDSHGQRIDLLEVAKSLTETGQIGEWPVWLPGKQMRVAGKVCGLRKSEQAIGYAHRRLKKRATKRQTHTKPETWEFAKCVLVFTSCQDLPAREALEWYRVRWQVELAFKRMKSLAQLGHLPKYDERSSRAWLYGKLFVALLTQKLIRIGRDISPWGYLWVAGSTSQRVEGVRLCSAPNP